MTLEGFLATLGLLVLMVLAMVVLARGWPRSSRLGGYHVAHREDEAATGPPGQGPSIAEEDDDGAGGTPPPGP